MKSKMITHILWACIFVLTILIAIRYTQRETWPIGLNNVKELITDQTLPALESTNKDILPEQQLKKDNIAEQKF